MTNDRQTHALTTARIFCIALAICGGFAATAQASTVGGWWEGNWNCNIDGRPARMNWHTVNTDSGECDGETCTSAAGAAWRGKFSDNGSQWVPLTHAREGTKGGLYFRHADGNQWYLRKPTGNRTSGWTTWNGNRYALSCWR